MNTQIYPWIKKERNRQQLQKEKENYYKDRDRFQRFYQTSAWPRIRLFVLADNPFCAICKHEIATEVDHIVSLAINYNLRLTLSNLQSFCGTCHKKKTVQDTKDKI